jgi:pimeloyl-ACP methyl ester carboxylesterase
MLWKSHLVHCMKRFEESIEGEETVRYTDVEVLGHSIAASAANEHLPGVPIVFLHGFTASLRFWEPSLPEQVKKNRRWYSISLPGHYPSQWPEQDTVREMPQDALAEVIAGAITQLVGDGPVGIVGWSTGGFLALNLAALRPEMVASVLSISGFSCGRWGGMLGTVQQLARRSKAEQRLAEVGLKITTRQRQMFETSLRAHAKEVGTDQKRQMLKDTVRAMFGDVQNHDSRLLAELAAVIHDFDLGDRLDDIRCPVIVAGGDSDPIIPFAHTTQIARRIPQSDLVRFSNTGHLFFAESTELYHELLNHWLRELDPATDETNEHHALATSRISYA